MNYNILFETLYSYTITEDVKSSIVERVKDRIGDELNESLNNGSHYVAFINTLLESDISDEALDETLELAFGGLSEEVIDEITEEFKRVAAIKVINEWDPAPVGLAGVRREAAKQQEKASQPKAMDRLKSAVGKVKGWAKAGAEKVKAGVEKAKSAMNQPTGLDKLKQMRSEMVKHAVKMGTGPKVEKFEAPKSVVKPEAPKVEQPKAKAKTAAPKTSDVAKAVKAAEEPKNKVEKEPAKVKTPAKVKKATAAVEPKSKQLKLDVEKPKVEAKKTKAGAKGKTVKTVEPEPPKVEASKNTRKAKTTSLKKAAKKVIADAEQPKEKVPIKRGRKKALQEALELIKSTSISESSLMEIVEMISNKKAAKKAVEREYNRFTKAVDSLNDVEVMKARTGISPVTSEQHEQMVKKAEEAGNKYEQVKASSERKFGKEC